MGKRVTELTPITLYKDLVWAHFEQSLMNENLEWINQLTILIAILGLKEKVAKDRGILASIIKKTDRRHRAREAERIQISTNLISSCGDQGNNRILRDPSKISSPIHKDN